MLTSPRREQLQLLQLQFLFLLFPPFSIFNILSKRLHTIDNVIFQPNYLQWKTISYSTGRIERVKNKYLSQHIHRRGTSLIRTRNKNTQYRSKSNREHLHASVTCAWRQIRTGGGNDPRPTVVTHASRDQKIRASRTFGRFDHHQSWKKKEMRHTLKWKLGGLKQFLNRVKRTNLEWYEAYRYTAKRVR